MCGAGAIQWKDLELNPFFLHNITREERLMRGLPQHPLGSPPASEHGVYPETDFLVLPPCSLTSHPIGASRNLSMASVCIHWLCHCPHNLSNYVEATDLYSCLVFKAFQFCLSGPVFPEAFRSSADSCPRYTFFFIWLPNLSCPLHDFPSCVKDTVQ